VDVEQKLVVLEATMTRRTIGLISIILTLTLGIGALMVVPAVYAETKSGVAHETATTERTLTAGDQTNLQTLKGLYKTIGDLAKQIRDQVKADKAAGKSLTGFATALKTAQQDATHREISRGVMLTDAERTQLANSQASIRLLQQQLKTQRKAKTDKATLDTLKANIKTAIAARTASLKAIHTAALTNYSARLLTLIGEAQAKISFMTGLLNTLTTLS
jgi:hypothetical protein